MVRGLREIRKCYRYTPRAEAHLDRMNRKRYKKKEKILSEEIERALEGQQTKIAISCLVSNGERKAFKS